MRLLQEEYFLTEKQLGQLEQYYRLLVEANKQINLTAITEREEVYLKHFYDSLTISKLIEIRKGFSVIDVGTGAGFPGIPIKIAYPEAKVLLLDSLRKRVNFLQNIIKECELENIETLHGRAEDAAQKNELREKFDLATARAVARLNVLVEYLLPFVKLGGHCIVMKGPGAEEEIEEAKKAIESLGGELQEVQKLKLPNGMGDRCLIVMKKKRGTPKRFPRKAGVPIKTPIS